METMVPQQTADDKTALAWTVAPGGTPSETVEIYDASGVTVGYLTGFSDADITRIISAVNAPPSATIAELMRQRDQARFEAHAARHSQPGRYAFHFRHMALCYVLEHAPEVYNAAHAAAYARIAAEGARAYEDVVAGLEAQVAALREAGAQAHTALNDAHDALNEASALIGRKNHGVVVPAMNASAAAIAVLEKAGVVS